MTVAGRASAASSLNRFAYAAPVVSSYSPLSAATTGLLSMIEACLFEQCSGAVAITLSGSSFGTVGALNVTIGGALCPLVYALSCSRLRLHAERLLTAQWLVSH